MRFHDGSWGGRDIGNVATAKARVPDSPVYKKELLPKSQSLRLSQHRLNH